MVNKNMVSKKTLLVTSGILGILLMVAGLQACAATPTSLPSYISPGTTINGYKLEWYDNITVNDFENTNVNVTCWTTIWWNNVTSRIIAASLVDKGGNILNKAVDLTKTDSKTLIARGVLGLAGLSNSTMNGIKTIWDVVIALLMLKNGTDYVLTQPDVPKADHAVLFTIMGHPYFKHALFVSKGADMLLALDYAIENWSSVTNWTDSALISAAVKIKLQADVWFFWGIFGTFLNFLNKAADWLASSSVPATSAASASSKISLSTNTPTSDMTSFASGWAGLLGGSIPGFEPLIILAMTTTAVVLIGFKVKKSRKE